MCVTPTEWLDEDVAQATRYLRQVLPHLPETIARLTVRSTMANLSPAMGLQAVVRESLKLMADFKVSMRAMHRLEPRIMTENLRDHSGSRP